MSLKISPLTKSFVGILKNFQDFEMLIVEKTDLVVFARPLNFDLLLQEFNQQSSEAMLISRRPACQRSTTVC